MSNSHTWYDQEVARARTLTTREEKLKCLLDAIHDRTHGIGRSKLDRKVLEYYIIEGEPLGDSITMIDDAGRTQILAVTADQRDLVRRVYLEHIKPFISVGTPQEREIVRKSAPWLFPPEVVMKDGLQTGCASTAPAFVVLARRVDLGARLAICAKVDDFRRACPIVGQRRAPDVMMDGHHVAVIEQDNHRWAILDTVHTHVSWATEPYGHALSFGSPHEAVNHWVKFEGNPNDYVVRGVEGPYLDLLEVRNFNTAMNVKTSCRHDSDLVVALPDRPPPYGRPSP